MKTITLSMMVSVDGFIECSHKELDWQVLNAELENYIFTEILDKADVILLGRVAYRRLAEHWPAAVGNAPPQPADMPRDGFSRTRRRIGWNAARDVEVDLADQGSGVQRQSGNELVVLAGPAVARTLVRSGWVQEYQVTASSSFFGNGTGLLRELRGRPRASILNSKRFECKHVVLFHRPACEIRREAERLCPDYVYVKKWVPRDSVDLPPKASSNGAEFQPRARRIGATVIYTDEESTTAT